MGWCQIDGPDWCRIHSPAQAVIVLLVALALAGLVALGDALGWWRSKR
jgi:hypothetical protein